MAQLQSTVVTGSLYISGSDPRVGIGTTSPDAILQIANNDGSSYRFGFGATSDVYLDADNVYIRTDNGGANTATFTTTGLGIGTTSPSQVLHVKGNILVEDNDSTDTVAQIGNSGDDGWINLYANGVSKAFVGANTTSYFNGGDVGIGTNSPDSKLHVSSGDIRITNNSPSIYFYDSDVSNLYHRILGGGNKGLEYSVDPNNVTAGYHRWDIGGSEVMRLIEGGNLGIGTTSPGKILDLESADALAIRFYSGSVFKAGLESATTAGQMIGTSNVGDFTIRSQANLLFSTGGNTERMRIDSSGRLFLGTATVAAANAAADDFVIKGEGTAVGLTISNSSDAGTGTIFFGDSTSSTAAGFRYNHNTGDMAISAEDNITITADRVGISETDPTAKLHIVGQNTSGLIVENQDGIASPNPYVSIAANNYSSADGTFRWEDLRASQASPSFIWNVADSSGTVLGFDFQTGDTSRLAIDQSGNVGIGTTNPTSKLEVEGSSLLKGLVTVTDDIFPEQNYVSNIGSIEKKFLTLHVAELVAETLVASERRATVGGRFNVGIATQLSASLNNSATTIYVKHNNLNNGDIIHLEGDDTGTPKVEFMSVNSGDTPVGDGFSYTVTRNLDGSGANEWDAGSGVFNTGTIGNGFIDQYAINSLRSGSGLGFSTAGPTIAFMERTGSAYPDIDIRTGVGNLKGWYGYNTDKFGFAAGDYKNQNITVDESNGLRIRSGSDIQLHASSSRLSIGDSFLYDSLNGILYVSGSNIQLVTPSFFLGGENQYVSGSNGNIEISGSNFHLLNGNVTASNVDLSGKITATSGEVGGWTINNGDLSSTNITLSSDNESIALGSPTPDSLTSDGIFLSGSGEFNFQLSPTKYIRQSDGVLDIQTDKFFIGSESTQFISGANSNIEISSSLFHLDPQSSTLIIGADAVINASVTADSIRTPATIGGAPSTVANASASIDSNGFAKFVSASIGGFDVSADAISGNNFYLSGSATGNEFFISSSNFNVKANGDLTASNANIEGRIVAETGELRDLDVTGTLTMTDTSNGTITNTDGNYIISSSGIILASPSGSSAPVTSRLTFKSSVGAFPIYTEFNSVGELFFNGFENELTLRATSNTSDPSLRLEGDNRIDFYVNSGREAYLDSSKLYLFEALRIGSYLDGDGYRFSNVDGSGQTSDELSLAADQGQNEDEGGGVVGGQDGTNFTISGGKGGDITFGNNDAADGGNLILKAGSGGVNTVGSGNPGASGSIQMFGNVGIGTDSPTEKLEVTGNTILDASNANLKIKAGVTGTKGDIQWTFNTDSTVYASAGIEYDNRGTDGFLIDSGYPITMDFAGSYIRWQYNGNEKMRLNSSGNVGIGTINPGQKLEVNGSIFASSGDITGSNFRVGQYIVHSGDTNTYIRFQTDDISLVAGGSNLFRVDNTAPLREIVVNESGASTNFRVESDTVTNALVVSGSNGNVGIGTSTPTQTLDVDGTVRIQNTGAATLILDGDTNNSGDTGQTDSIIDMRHDAGTYGMRLSARNFSGKTAFRIQENRNSVYSDRFYIDEDGDVGIGTITPQAKLHVEGNISASGNLTVEGSINGTIAPSGNLSITGGNVVLDSGQGIDFSATSDASGTGVVMSSELLDDYEEGTWSPLWTGGGISSLTMNIINAHYTRVGNLVTVSAYFGTSAFAHVPSSGTNVYLHGLPFTPVANDYFAVNVGHATSWGDDSEDDVPSGGYIENAGSGARILFKFRSSADGATFDIKTDDFATNHTSPNPSVRNILMFSAIYYT